MKNKFFIAAMFLLISNVHALDLSDVKFNVREKIDNQEVELKGHGVQKKFFFKINAVAFYTNCSSKNLKEIINDDGNKELILVMLRDLSGEKVANQVEKDFKSFSTDKEYEELKDHINKIVNLYKSIDAIKEGTKIIVKWNNKVGVSATINGQPFGTTVNNRLLFDLILRPFLSDDAPKDLRKSLLSNE